MYQQKIFELSEKARQVGNADAFWESCNEALSASGVAGFGYGMMPFSIDATINGFSNAGFFKHTYPSEWETAVGESTSIDNDVSVEMIVNGTPELIWNDPSLLEEASEDQLQQDEIDNDIGMRFGASLALDRNTFGQAISGIGLWVSDTRSDKEFAPYWHQHRKHLHQICHILDEGLRGRHAQLLVALTPRERDCLTYLAIGLRPAEICWRLKISEKTFEKYIKWAKEKLRARTRDHAIAKALVLNLIQP